LRQRMALTYRNMATTLLSQGERQRALESALHARDLDQELLDKQPLSPDAQMNLAFDVGQIGAAYSELKDYRSAAENWGLSVALREKVSLANPDDYRSKERLGFALDALGRVEFLQGDRAAAHRDFRRCVHLYGDLSARGHLVSQSLYEFASGSYYLGTLTAADNRAEACKWFRKSVELFDECYKTEKSGYGEADVVAAAHARAAACSP
jgi:tetratricopeptide (TPR) repeat protein